MWNANGTLKDANAGEVNMVPATVGSGLPANWPTDGRNGGVPDPKAIGPRFIQIGNEGGFLPNPDVISSTPVGYEYFRRTITVLNVKQKSLYLGPAERADVIVDFSQVPNGSKLILYNDAPAPMPAFDERNDFYTGDPDQTSSGGAPSTLPGYGPNTRTIMQIQVDNTLSGGTAAPAFNLATLKTALPAAFAADQPTPIVPEAAYNNAYKAAFTNKYFAVADTSMTFTPIGQTKPVTISFGDKAIIEGFELNYGRMNAQLGGTLTNIGPAGPGAVPYGYVDPATDIISNTPTGTQIGALGDGTQIWRISHQGVDTHVIHFHLMNVQVINRVALDGQVFPPDDNEVGWKESIRMNPGQDVVIAMRPKTPVLPWRVPNSVRSPDPTAPPTATWTVAVPPATPGGPVVNATVTNTPVNFGWEYVWHCHLLDHEENDMMRPLVFKNTYKSPTYRNYGAADQYARSIQLSSVFPAGVSAVVLARGDVYANGLAAGPLAAAYGGPVLLTRNTGLTTSLITELKRLHPATVFLVGLPASPFTTQIKASTVLPTATVTQLGGTTDPYAIAVAVANQMKAKLGTISKVVVAPGDAYGEAMTAANLAAANKWPVLLTPQAGAKLNTASANEIAALGVKSAVVVGTYAAMPAGVTFDRIVGANGYDTNVRVAEYGLTRGLMRVAHTGIANFPDGLSAVGYLARYRGVLLQTPFDGVE